jgi:ring-1,2-phenylacetyl-CoA epoxidase subunit PaaD
MVIETENRISEEAVLEALHRVKDPEIPVLSIVDMAMVSGVFISESQIEILFLPTFIGCPAIDIIKKNIKEEVEKLGVPTIVKTDSEKQWNTNMLSEEAKNKLEKFGLAPPPELKEEDFTLEQLDRVRCPHCHSTDTTLRSSFGSTLCRAIRFCFHCKQGFEQFKPLQ